MADGLPGASGEVLGAGTLNAPRRVGDTVVRPTGPWSPAVHQVLRHLEDVGFQGAPRALELDMDRGYEVLSYLPGDVGNAPPLSPTVQTDEALVGAARLIRECHDALSSFPPPAGAVWQKLEAAPEGGGFVCHNDLAPYNFVYQDGVPQGIIDWDFAAPRPRRWDLAHAIWYAVPLHDRRYRRYVGWRDVDVARRLRLFCDAYGLDDREGLLDLIAARQAATFATIEARAAAGLPGWVELLHDPPEVTERPDLDLLRRHREAWQQAIL